MLVQFMLKNVLSFRDETILDMTAIRAYKEHECNLVDVGTKEKLLKVAAIYGANASGKSNLYLAMRYFKRIIMKSFNNVNDEEDTVIRECFFPFLFDDNKDNSEFQIVVVVEDDEYRYGFEYNEDCIVTEWLYKKSMKTNRTITVFERTTEHVAFGPSIRKECDVYKEQIPGETLVLSFFNRLRLKNTVFQIVYREIMKIAVVPMEFEKNKKNFQNVLPGVIDHEKEKLVRFLSAIDTGICDISYDNEEEEETYFYTYHVGKDGKFYQLDLWDESDGTIKSVMFFLWARSAISKHGVLFVDELNMKLHPLLLKFMIDLFYEPDVSAQLIYTTHDTTLMDKKFFRRDQIWFVQKDENGYSELSSLSDFKVRPDASFEKDYLAGVYGGIPFLKEFEIKGDS